MRRAASSQGSSDTTAATTGGVTVSMGTTPTQRGAKVRVTRERRRRGRDGPAELEQKVSKLSVSAAAFTPAGMTSAASAASTGGGGAGGAIASTLAAPTASSLAKAKPKPKAKDKDKAKPRAKQVDQSSRRVPPAHRKLQQTQTQTQILSDSQPASSQQSLASLSQSSASNSSNGAVRRPTPMSQWTVASSSPVTETEAGSRNMANVTERRPRRQRQRMGAMGFSRTTSSAMPRGRTATNSSSSTSSSSHGSTLTSFKSSTLQLGGDPAKPLQQRKRSDSVGSEPDYSSDEDDVYPEEAISSVSPGTASNPAGSGPGGGNNSTGTTTSAFPERLSLLGQQKKVPTRVVSREAVVDTVFAALFAHRNKASSSSSSTDGATMVRRPMSVFGEDDDDDTDGTDTEAPNEEFVKRGLASSLFKDSLQGLSLSMGAGMTDHEAVQRFITPSFIHTLVTALRFEDYRTASARIDILRAIHKSYPDKRVHMARALADAASLRLEYVRAVTRVAHARGIEKTRVLPVDPDHVHDHGHGFTELLRYAIEHVGESERGLPPATKGEAHAAMASVQALERDYLVALLALWKTHWWDPSGSDDEELISCAGQTVAYLPHLSRELLERLLLQWPRRFPAQQIVAIRMVARVLMSSPPLVPQDAGSAPLARRIFSQLAACVTSPHAQVANEALAFTGCQFALVHFLGQYWDVYHVVSEAFHANATNHWNDKIRTTSEGHFDRALDYAP